jgi:hypothetical protein
MAKNKAANVAAQATAGANGATPAQAAAANGQVKIAIITGVAFTANPFAPNSARWHYYNACQSFVGQPVSAYAAAIVANPPCLTKKGTVEPPVPFLNWLVRHKYVTTGYKNA